MAARRNKRMVTQAEFEDAKDKVMMGAERKSLVMTEEEKMLTAYHEGATPSWRSTSRRPIRCTRRPSFRAGARWHGDAASERDKLSMSVEQMTSRLAIMMGGRVAEELVFGKERVTSGASSDIEQATKLARMMVTRWACRKNSARSHTAKTRTRCSSHVGCPTQNVSEQRRRRLI